MEFRVTTRLGVDFATRALGQQTAELQKTQQQISTGLRLQRPSDDPAAVRRSIVQKDQLSRLQTNTVSVEQSKSRLSQAHVQLRSAQELFVQARQVGLSAAQATEPSEISILAKEVDGILNQLISIANASDEIGYLFAGTASQTQPFDIDITRPNDAATYLGTSADSQLHLTGDISRDVLIPGDAIFKAIVRGPTEVIGDSGITAGTGTSTARGSRQLSVVHTSTTIVGTSGITVGTSSAGSDTIVGGLGRHQLEVVDTSGTGTAGTVSLNNGAPVAFSNPSTDLKVTGPSGELVYLNLSSLTAGFNGTVDLIADGTLSLDGGTTVVPLTFETNQAFTDPTDGSTIFLDTSTTHKVSEGSVEFTGTTDVFDVLIALRNDLLNTRGLNTGDRLAALNRRLGDIERVENHLLDEIGSQSVGLQQLDYLQTRTEDQTLEQKIKYSETTSADLAEAAVHLQELLNLQQFTSAAVAKLLSQNLLQYLN